jgi:hypothetical protein
MKRRKGFSMQKEGKGFRRTEYRIRSGKVRDALTFVLLSDFHGAGCAQGREGLVRSILAEKPDLVLAAGDMVSAEKAEKKQGIQEAEALLCSLAKSTGVCVSPGNHETKMLQNPGIYGKNIEAYERALNYGGVTLLHNESKSFSIKHTEVKVSGLELGREYFKKLREKELTEEKLESLLGDGRWEGLHILLAHNPHFGACYFRWGADLILSGHNHGGVVGIPGCGGILTPQLRLLDTYTAGAFFHKTQTLIVSRGLGDHVPVPRIRNPREYVVIKVYPVQEEKNNGN